MLRGIVVTLFVVGSLVAPATADASEPHWVGAWTASPQAGGDAVKNETYRQFVHTSIGGGQVRLRFSNRYGEVPLTLRHVNVALPSSPTQPAVDASTLRAVRFASGDAVTIPAGQEVRSLPVRFDVPGNAWLAVSFHVPGNFTTSTTHAWAWGVNWKTPPGLGDRANEASGASFVSMTDWRYLTGVDVTAPARVSTVVALGDSITDSTASVPGTNTRWPDLLNKRLGSVMGGRRFSVVNAGINGNSVSVARGHDLEYGDAAVRRVEWDVFAIPNVSTLVLFEGINDVADHVPTEKIVGAYDHIVAEAHRRGIRVVISTLTPHTVNGTERSAVNRWIRRNGFRFDGVLGFGEVVQNPLVPWTWKQRYSAGDQTHPNPLGLKAMADSVPLGVFR